MQKKIKNVIAAVTLAVIVTVPACGYHLSGTGNIVPQGVNKLSIPVFFNATNEPYVDMEMTQAVVEEFLTDGRMKVVSLEDADLALRGKITKYEVIPLSYNPQSYVQQYRIHMVVEAVLEDLRSKKILWRERGIESDFISDYAVSYDPAGKAEITLTKNAKDAAIKNASKDIAQTLRSRVLEGF